MNPNENRDQDRRLNELLRQWTVEAPLPPRFHEQVWSRIENLETSPANPLPWRGWIESWIASLTPRPAYAAACCVLLLATGATAGWWQARQAVAQVTSELAARYAQSLNPYHHTPR